jgi:hypothetical protein
MTEDECLKRMVAPGTHRPGKYGSGSGFGGVIQILVTSSCDKSCFACTQGSNLARPRWEMTPDQFKAAVESLRGYPGIVGVFGGNPALSPHFLDYCEILKRSWVPPERRGIWCNNPITIFKAQVMAETFNPAVSNLNVHLDQVAFRKFKEGWPQCHPVGLTTDSRHSPVHLAMRDVLKKLCGMCGGKKTIRMSDDDFDGLPCGGCGGTGLVYDEWKAWELISGCDINQHWSAMIAVFRGELRAWFCEVAGAQAILHQDEPDYPDTGLDPTQPLMEIHNDWPGEGHAIRMGAFVSWWQLGMPSFRGQVRKHCHECGVPLRGVGQLAQGPEDQGEQTSPTHSGVFRPKRPGRRVQVVTDLVQLGTGRLDSTIKYLQNAK